MDPVFLEEKTYASDIDHVFRFMETYDMLPSQEDKPQYARAICAVKRDLVANFDHNTHMSHHYDDASDFVVGVYMMVNAPYRAEFLHFLGVHSLFHTIAKRIDENLQHMCNVRHVTVNFNAWEYADYLVYLYDITFQLSEKCSSAQLTLIVHHASQVMLNGMVCTQRRGHTALWPHRDLSWLMIMERMLLQTLTSQLSKCKRQHMGRDFLVRACALCTMQLQQCLHHHPSAPTERGKLLEEEIYHLFLVTLHA